MLNHNEQKYSRHKLAGSRQILAQRRLRSYVNNCGKRSAPSAELWNPELLRLLHNLQQQLLAALLSPLRLVLQTKQRNRKLWLKHFLSDCQPSPQPQPQPHAIQGNSVLKLEKQLPQPALQRGERWDTADQKSMKPKGWKLHHNHVLISLTWTDSTFCQIRLAHISFYFILSDFFLNFITSFFYRSNAFSHLFVICKCFCFLRVITQTFLNVTNSKLCEHICIYVCWLYC